MKNKHKKQILLISTILTVFSFTTISNNVATNATTTNKNNIDFIILFNDNAVDKNVEDIVTSSGGTVVKEFPDLGGIEVKCPSELIPTIKAVGSVQSLAPNHAIKLSANGKTKGVAPGIGFKSYRVFNEDGDTTETICSSAIIDAVNDGVKVINVSISGYDLKGKCYWTYREF